ASSLALSISASNRQNSVLALGEALVVDVETVDAVDVVVPLDAVEVVVVVDFAEDPVVAAVVTVLDAPSVPLVGVDDVDSSAGDVVATAVVSCPMGMGVPTTVVPGCRVVVVAGAVRVTSTAVEVGVDEAV